MGHSGRIGRSRQHNAVPGSHKRPPPPHRHRKSLTAAPIAGRAQLDPGAATPAHRHSAVSGHPLRQPFDTSHLEHVTRALESFTRKYATTLNPNLGGHRRASNSPSIVGLSVAAGIRVDGRGLVVGVLELVPRLLPAARDALADLERRTVDADGGRLKLEWGALNGQSGDDVHDVLWWEGQRLLGFVGLYSFG